MKSLNRVQAIGNVTKNPEIKTLESGAKFASFSLEIVNTFKKRDGTEGKEIEYMNCSVGGELVEFVEKTVREGQRLYIEGKFQTRTYEKEGQKKYFTSVYLFSIEKFTCDIKAKEVSKDEPVGIDSIPF